MSLDHSPCGNPPFIDPDFPYQDGSSGAWGYDHRNDQLVNPEKPDLMGYCEPRWISDYSFNHALRYQESQSRTPVLASVYAPSTRSLLLWGGVSEDGTLVLEPSFVVDTPPNMTSREGPYQLTGESSDGDVLFTVNFGMAEVADGVGGAFAFLLPVRTDWPDRLSRITLTGPEGIAKLDEEYDKTAALLMDESTGLVRGILRDWPDPESTVPTARRVLPEPGLDVLISRGVPSPAAWRR